MTNCSDLAGRCPACPGAFCRSCPLSQRPTALAAIHADPDSANWLHSSTTTCWNAGGLNLPDDFFATLLNRRRHVSIADGLDEVANEDERALVSQAVSDLTSGADHTFGWWSPAERRHTRAGRC